MVRPNDEPWHRLISLRFVQGTLVGLATLVAPVFCGLGQTNPVQVAVTGTAVYGEASIKVRGDYAYVLAMTEGLMIYNVSNPANPIFLSDLASGWLHFDLALTGNYAYLVGDHGLDICDISNPTNALWVKRVELSQCYGTVTDLSVSGNYAYVPAGCDGLRIFDISNPTNPVIVAQISDVPIVSVAVSGSYAYVAANVSGHYRLRVYDVSTPARPVRVGPDGSELDISGITVSGNRAYVRIGGTNDLTGNGIYDLSNPTNPVLAGDIRNPFPPQVAVSGNYLYSPVLGIYDVSDPANPIQRSTFSRGFEEYLVAVSGEYAYCCGGGSLVIYRLGAPAPPTLSILPMPYQSTRLSWPTPAPAFAVQQSPGLHPANWVTLPNQPVVAGSENQVMLQGPTGTAFYRLVSQ